MDQDQDQAFHVVSQLNEGAVVPLLTIKSWSRITMLLLSLLTSISIGAQENTDSEFSFMIMDVFSITGRGTILTGQVKSGSLNIDDTVCIPLKSGKTAARTVEGIEMFRKLVERAEKGQIAGVLVQIDKKLVDKGVLLHGDCTLESIQE